MIEACSGPCECAQCQEDEQAPVGSLSYRQQLAQMLEALPPNDAIVFLAGARFAQGHAEYGDAMFKKPLEELRMDSLEEAADHFVYETAIDARFAE